MEANDGRSISFENIMQVPGRKGGAVWVERGSDRAKIICDEFAYKVAKENNYNDLLKGGSGEVNGAKEIDALH